MDDWSRVSIPTKFKWLIVPRQKGFASVIVVKFSMVYAAKLASSKALWNNSLFVEKKNKTLDLRCFVSVLLNWVRTVDCCKQNRSEQLSGEGRTSSSVPKVASLLCCSLNRKTRYAFLNGRSTFVKLFERIWFKHQSALTIPRSNLRSFSLG